MQFENFQKNFVDRTIKILEDLSDETDYEVTLLINCLYGLIFFPTEHQYERKFYKYQKYVISKIYEYGDVMQKQDDSKTFRCIKNALSHLNIQTSNENGIITHILFKDKIPGEESYHTEIQFSVEKLRLYALDIARYYSKFI